MELSKLFGSFIFLYYICIVNKKTNMEVYFKRTEDEFMLLPNFTMDSWFNYTTFKWQRVVTIGWLFWFVRFIKDI